MDHPPLIEAEVVLPGHPGQRPVDSAPRGPGATAAASEPFHPAAAALLLLVDNFWMLPEFAIATWWFTIPICFLTVFASTVYFQRFAARNAWPVALAKAVFFGLVAAVPFSVMGTPIGLAFLAWAGIKRLAR